MKTSPYKNTAENTIHEEKRRIFREMAAYRRQHGIGSFRLLSAATGGKVASMTISHMYMGTKINDEVWRQVGAVLEKLREC